MSREDAETAIRQAQKTINRYYHRACKTKTDVIPGVVEAAVLDPWAFPLFETDCAGCGTAKMKDVVLKDKRTLYAAFKEMRAAVPLSGKLARFAGIPLCIGLLVSPVAFLFPNPNVNPLAAMALFGMLGAVGGFYVKSPIFRTLRRAGLFW